MEGVTADVTPWSSVVGNGIALKNKDGAVCAMLSIMPDPGGLIRDRAEVRPWAEKLAEHIASLINAHS